MDNSQLAGPRILIIDPDDGFRDEVCRSLAPGKRRGGFKEGFSKITDRLFDRSSGERNCADYDLVFVADLKEALDAVNHAKSNANPFAIIIVEVVKLSRWQGRDILSEIRRLDESVNILLLLSGSDPSIAEISAAVPPSDNVFYLAAPLTAQEIKNLTMIIVAKWRGETRANRRIQLLNSANHKSAGLLASRTRELKGAKAQLVALEDELRLNRELQSHLARELEDSSVAMKVLLKNMAADDPGLDRKVLAMKVRKMDETVVMNVKQLSEPFLDMLAGTNLDDEQKEYLSILRVNLDQVTSPIIHRLHSTDYGFTPSELQVANLVRQGKSSKTIASALNLSVRTVEFHRDKIRKKLGLKGRKTGLKAALDTYDYPAD